MKEEINRLGFGAWAENKIVNIIEDWKEDLINSKVTSISIENENYTIRATYEFKHLSISIRAYVEGDGWQELEQNVNIV